MIEKCCFFLPVDVGCLILGVTTLLFSLVSGIFSIILLSIEEADVKEGFEYFYTITHLDFNESTIKIVLSASITIELLWIIFSIFLVIGIYKNKPNFVLCYFGFGTMMAIVWSLNGLLLLLNYHWIMAMIVFILACVYSYCLAIVHLTYEQMLNGKLSRFVPHHDSDETILVGSESDLPESELRL